MCLEEGNLSAVRKTNMNIQNDNMISIIIPTLNEEKGIVKTLKQINQLDLDKEVIVVDGLSKDKTIKNAEKYGARVVREIRKGKGIAMQTGVEVSNGSVVAFVDGDGSYPVEYFEKMSKYVDKCDMVVASRLLMKPSIYDSVSTFIYYNMFNVLTKSYLSKFKTSEPVTGMRMMKKQTWYDLNLSSTNFMIELEMEVEMAKRGMKVIEIPVPCLKRIGGHSKFLYPRNWKTVWHMRKFIKANEQYLDGLKLMGEENVQFSLAQQNR